MKIQVDSKFLSYVFGEFVKNNKLLFNFKTDGRFLYVQMLEDYTVCTTIPVVSLDNDYQVVDASFWVTKAIGVLDKDKPTALTFADAVMFLEQENFNCTFVKEYEARREFPDASSLELKPAYANRLKYLAHSVISCSPLARELSVPDPDPVFCHGRFYANYRELFFVENMNYPEICIAYETFRNFAFRLDEKAMYAYLSDLNMLYIASGLYEMWIPTVNYNIDGSAISAVDKKLQECIKVSELCFTEYADKMLILSSSFPKQRLGFFVGNGEFRLAISTNDTQCTIGTLSAPPLLGINITSAQVAVIAKIFKDDEVVECWRGGNCICLRSGEKNILIAGMLF